MYTWRFSCVFILLNILISLKETRNNHVFHDIKSPDKLLGSVLVVT